MEERELFNRAQNGDKEAKEQLFEKNTGLVYHVVKRFAGRGGANGVETEDLFQIGAMGLVKAIEKFDMDYGVCFSTYAVPLI
ncbi:MAG: sigma-70 family RNA polymerase sigma factor, partial [Lachnospiraceae bacterium]|nr:sigma-70 family RNA polymerase sigma factor [Lachnospiraceae bacterium]